MYVEHKVVQEPIGSVRRVERKGEYMSGYNRSNLILYSDNDLSQAGNQYIYVQLYPDKTYIICEIVLFCFVWLATLGMPVVAPGTAAGPFRRVAEAPFWVPSSPVVERGALSTEVPPHLKRGEVPGHCRPGHPRSSFGGARAHSPCERTQR